MKILVAIPLKMGSHRMSINEGILVSVLNPIYDETTQLLSLLDDVDNVLADCIEDNGAPAMAAGVYQLEIYQFKDPRLATTPRYKIKSIKQLPIDEFAMSLVPEYEWREDVLDKT